MRLHEKFCSCTTSHRRHLSNGSLTPSHWMGQAEPQISADGTVNFSFSIAHSEGTPVLLKWLWKRYVNGSVDPDYWTENGQWQGSATPGSGARTQVGTGTFSANWTPHSAPATPPSPGQAAAVLHPTSMNSLARTVLVPAKSSTCPHHARFGGRRYRSRHRPSDVIRPGPPDHQCAAEPGAHATIPRLRGQPRYRSTRQHPHGP